MKVIFLQDVSQAGKAGEVKEVADGFGRNFLFPNKLAVLASAEALQMTEAQRKAAERQRKRSQEELQELAHKLDGLALTLKVKTGPNERLYGAIKNLHIAREISRLVGFDVDKRTIKLEEPIRKLGAYEVYVQLGRELAPKIKIMVEEGKE